MPSRPRSRNILNTRVKKPRRRLGEAARMLAELEEVEEEWCERQCNDLNSVLMGSAAGSTNFLESLEEEVDQFPQPFDRDDQTEHIDDETSYNSDSGDSNITQASLVSDGVTTQVLGDINRRRRIREEEQWQEVITPMFKMFMVCSDRSRQWTDPGTWSHDLKPECRCSQAKTRYRDVELVDILSKLSPISLSLHQDDQLDTRSCVYDIHFFFVRQAHHQLSISFCSCQPDQVRLIQLGYIGGSPKQPERAYSIRLLRLHDSLWKNCSIRTQPFSQALDDFHRPSFSFLEDVTKKVRGVI